MTKDLKRLKHLGIILILEDCETQMYCFRCSKMYKFDSSAFAYHSGCKSCWFDDDNITIDKKINIFFGNGEMEMKIHIKSQSLTNKTFIAKNPENFEMSAKVPIMNLNFENKVDSFKNLKDIDGLSSQIDIEMSAANVTESNIIFPEKIYIDDENINEPVSSAKNEDGIEEIKKHSENDSNVDDNDAIEIEDKTEHSFEEKFEQSSEESDYELPVEQMKYGEKTIEETLILESEKYFGHTCYLCSDKNMGYYDYRNHLRKKHDVLNCKCGCGLKYPSFMEYRRHRLYYCLYCGYNGQKISKKTLGTHCCPNKQYLCHICSKQFAEKPGLELHIESTHKKVKNYRCTLCTYKANRKNNLRVHYYMHNVIIQFGEQIPHLLMKNSRENDNLCKRKYNNECYVCFKKFNQKNYTKHFFRMHGKEQCPYRCDECSQLFHYYAEYKLHLPNKCFYCGANTSKDEEHKCDLKKPKLRCDFCHTNFKHEDRFLKHQEICKET